jgi:NAD(P) transhydrogenase subunit alpha
MNNELIANLFVFALAAFIGMEVIKRVSPLLHTPLMSLTNALDAIAVLGAIALVGAHHEHHDLYVKIFGSIAIIAATANIVGGLLITDRMIKMFKADKPAKGSSNGSAH